MHQTITVPKVNVAMLRQQRDWLVKLANGVTGASVEGVSSDGLISLLDSMLDIAEGETGDMVTTKIRDINTASLIAESKSHTLPEGQHEARGLALDLFAGTSAHKASVYWVTVTAEGVAAFRGTL